MASSQPQYNPATPTDPRYVPASVTQQPALWRRQWDGYPQGLGSGIPYRVRLGDTPVSLAVRFTGDASRYPELFGANPFREVLDAYLMPDGSLVAVPQGFPGPWNGLYASSNFASFQPGDVVLLPASWTQQIQPWQPRPWRPWRPVWTQ